MGEFVGVFHSESFRILFGRSRAEKAPSIGEEEQSAEGSRLRGGGRGESIERRACS